MRNTKYTKKIHQRIVGAVKDGATQRAAARRVGVTAETLTAWKKRFRAFGEDVERAHAEAQVFAETSLYTLAIKGNVRALTAWLEKRRPAEWGDAATKAPGGEPVTMIVECGFDPAEVRGPAPDDAKG